MGLLDRLSALLGGADEERLASDPLVLDTGTAGAAPVVPEADELTAPDLRARAEEFADRNGGTGLGFTLDSLARLDEVTVEQPTVLAYLDGAVGEGDPASETGGPSGPADDRPAVEPGGRVLDFGSYAGEVLVAEFDGEWVDEDGWGVAVPLEGHPVVVPVFELAARAIGGDPRFHEVGSELDAGRVPRPVDSETAGVRTAMAAATLEVSAYWADYDLDVRPDSLARLDALVDAEWDVDRFRTARFGDDDPDSHVYTELVRHLGSYYGEALIRHFDAEWTSDPDLGTVVDVKGQGGTAVANVFVVAANRLTDDERFALDFDVLAANLDLDAPPVSEHGYEVVRADPGALDAVRDREPEAIADAFAENAATLAGEWPDYGLDYTPHSLRRLDALASREFEPFDLASAELGGATDADSLVLTARAMEAGGYLAEVFRREFGGRWRPDDLEFVVRGRSAEATLDPVGIAATCLRGEGSFAATYAAIDDRLEAAVDEASTDGSGADGASGTGASGTSGDPGADGSPAGGSAGTDRPSRGSRSAPAAAPASAGGSTGSDPGRSDPGGDGPPAGGTGAVQNAPGAEHAPAASASDRRGEGGATEDRRDPVEALAAAWPDYDLDGSVASLVELDALVAAEYDRSGGDRDYDGDPLAVPEGTPAPEAAQSVGAYFGALLRRHHDASLEDGAVVVTGANGRVELAPERVAAACFAGESSFLDAYAHVAARAGLDTPLGE